MRKIYKHLTFILFAFIAVSGAKAQNIQLFNEDFENGGITFSMNTSSVGTNTGTNLWTVNNHYTGTPIYPNTMSEDSTYSGNISFAPYSKYLHVYDQNAFTASGIDNGNYDPTATSDRFVEMNAGVCTMGMTSVYFSFFYICEGSPTAYGEVYYSANGGPWIQTGQLQYNGRYKWQYETITNPAFCNVQSLKFGFRWVNDNTPTSNPVGLGIDDVFLDGFYDAVNAPVNINITLVTPNPVCQLSNLFVFFQLSDTLCDGTYEIELSDSTGNFASATNMGVFWLNYPTTSSAIAITIPGTLPPGTCYKVRINRTSPLPVITGTASICFSVIFCPNTITTLPPVVAMDSNAVCVGSVIDVPFYSTGVFNFNTYVCQLSDSNGVFAANPPVVGTFPNSQTYDQMNGSLPGTVSGIIPTVPPGCGYYLRVVSTSPVAIGTVWGPFCIQDCDINTNNHVDLHFCISTTQGGDTTITIGIHEWDSIAVYCPLDSFKVQLLSSQTFAQVNLGDFGEIQAGNDTTLIVHCPNLIALMGLGLQPGMYYMRIIATCASPYENSLGTVIRVVIGAPNDTASWIFPSDTAFCVGDIAQFLIVPYNPNSQYQWTSPSINGGTPFIWQYNPLLVNLGGSGALDLTVQEINNGCYGPISPACNVMINGPPSVFITGPTFVCIGDTAHYSVPFETNTYYQWTSQHGQMIDTSNNVMDIQFDTIGGPYQIRLTAVNDCGSATGIKNIYVRPFPTVNAGNDTAICKNDTLHLSTNTGSGYSYLWQSGATNIGTTASVNVEPQTSGWYTITTTGQGGCISKDSMMVTIIPVTNLNASDTICQGDTSLLDATLPGASYTWSTGDTIPALHITSTGLYTVQIVPPGSLCANTDSFAVDVEPRSTLLHVDSLCIGDIHVLDATNPGSNYVWNTGETTATINVTTGGIYTCQVFNPLARCANIDSFLIAANDCPVIPLIIPNVFSPNGNGFNDFFSPDTVGDYDQFKVLIYSRWGELLWESTIPTFAWPGVNKQGLAVPEGTYYYIIETTKKGKVDNRTGFVTLVR